MADSTTYIVLRELEDAEGKTESWTIIGSHAAKSADGAIRAVMASHYPEGVRGSVGKWVAVPLRSWKPVTVTAETQTVLKLS